MNIEYTQIDLIYKGISLIIRKVIEKGKKLIIPVLKICAIAFVAISTLIIFSYIGLVNIGLGVSSIMAYISYVLID